MSLLISGDLRLANTYVGIDDPDAQVYIAAVEAADEIASPGVGALEIATKVAIHSFVKGCKNDGIWPAIKASCILAGARTLAGALVPLVGTAFTNFNFVSGDYNRKTGLKGNASNKRLSNSSVYGATSLSRHGYIYCTEATTGGGYGILLGSVVAAGEIIKNDSTTSFIIRPWGGSSARSLTNGTGGLGIARQNNTEGVQFTTTSGASVISAAGAVGDMYLVIFDRTPSGGEATNPRIAFFSGGQFLGLPLLDARVATLINAFAAAIP